MARGGAPLRGLGLAAALAVMLPGTAGAVVGGRPAPEAAASAVMVLSSNGGVCTGIVVAPDAVLTAGHCVTGRAEHRVHYRDEAGAPVLAEIAARAPIPVTMRARWRGAAAPSTSPWCAWPRRCPPASGPPP